MAKYDELVQFIKDNIDGFENVNSATHCATRLRLQINNPNKVKLDKLKTDKQILGAVFRENELQLVIGPDVPKVYSVFSQEMDQDKKDGGSTAGSTIEVQKKKRSLKDYGAIVVDFISGTFVPILPVLVAAGLVSAVLNIGVTFFGLSAKGGTYVILNAINNAGFYFLPAFLGMSAARKLGINSIMGLFLGTILVHSSIDGVAHLSFLGMTIPKTTYNTSTVPVIFGVLFMALVDKAIDKWIPEAIKYFVKPLVVILITVPVTLIVLGPLGYEVGTVIAAGLSFMYQHLGWFSVGLIGAFTPLLVMTGTNQALFPLVFAMLAQFGYDSFVMPGMLAANTAVGAAALAISFIEKNEDKRALALSSGITGVMGITEPATFGVLLNYRSAFLGAMAGGGIAGIFAGLVKLKQYAVVSPGIAALPTFIPTNGEGFNSNFWFAVVTLVMAVVLSFAFTTLFQRRALRKAKMDTATEALKIVAPLSGKLIKLEDVPDQVFSQKMMGDGVAIEPSSDQVCAPADSLVIMTTETNHAIGLRTDNGVELLIHVGLDTVEMEGENMKTLVKDGDRVKAGTPLISFNSEAIEAAGYKLTTPVIVTNMADHHRVFAQSIQSEVKCGDYLYSTE
ncbi:glucose PTS transporter subunit IIA [Lacticaseibacillus pantheris]